MVEQQGLFAANAAPSFEGVSFEQLVGELDGIVAQLEGGQLSLEDSLKAFERGMALSKGASAILDAAEHRIEELSGTAEAPNLKPMDEPM